MIRHLLFLFGFVLMGLAPPTSVEADGVDWTLRNSAGSMLYVRFFDSGDGVWPGGRKFYTIKPGTERTMRLSCRSGEKICYGAINNNGNQYWGIGEFGREGCKSCCRTCGDLYTQVINLR